MPLGSFRFFSKIRRDNREWMLLSGVNNTGDYLFGGVKAKNLSPMSTTPAINPCHREITKSLKFFAGVNDTVDKLFGGVNNTGD
jgi:hypothetical protein